MGIKIPGKLFRPVATAVTPVMSFELDSIYVVYLLVAISPACSSRAPILLFFSGASYRKNVNRRLKLLKDEPNRESSWSSCARSAGSPARAIPRGFEAFNRLVLQSGLTIGIGKLLTFIAIGAVVSFVAGLFVRGDCSRLC